MVLSPIPTTFPEYSSSRFVRTTYQMPSNHFVAGFLIALFQLVGRSHATRFFSVSSLSPLFELRLWILLCLTSWLFLVASLRRVALTHSELHPMIAWRYSTLLFLCYMILTSLWAPNSALAGAKIYDLLLLSWACVLAASAMRLFGARALIDGFWIGILFVGLTLAVVGVASALARPQGITRLAILGGGPNVFGRNMGLLALVALQFVFVGRRWIRHLALMTAPVAALLVLLSGSRGAMLALFLGVVVLLFIHGFSRRLIYASFLLAIVMFVIIGTQLGELAATVFHQRFIILLLAERYFTNRDTLIVDALEAAIRHPLVGLGLAGFAELDSPGSYPHNFVLEALAEGGVIGFVLLARPFVRFFWRWRQGLTCGHSLTAAGLCLLIVSSSISGDLYDARGVLLLLLMATASQAKGVEMRNGRSG